MNGAWREVANREEWNDFVADFQSGSFLQSYEFGEFQQTLGKKIWRLGCKDSQLKGTCLLIKQKTKFGSFLYIPGGPLITENRILESLIKEITQLAREEKVSFVRFDPRIIGPDLASKYLSLGLVKVNNFTQPQCSLVLNLNESLEGIRSKFFESTRYNIGWVQRQGVTIKVSSDINEIELFEKLLSETATRHDFTLHGEKEYYRKQFEAFQKSGKAKLYLAYEPENEGQKVLASAVVINFGKTVTYLHAASSSLKPKLRAPYLMQWKIIEDAKNSGAEIYDFWGVAATDSPNDPWSGVTNFKKGFGGEKICYERAYDLILDKKYLLDSFLEKLRLKIRRWV